VRETAALPPWGGGVIHTPYTSNKASASWGRHHWYSRGYGYRSLITAGKPAVAPSLGCVCLRPRPAPVCPPDCRRCIPRHPQRWWRVSPTASGGLPSWQCRSTAHPTGHRVHADDESNTWRRSDNAHPRRATNDSRCLCRRSTAVQWPGYAYLPPRPLPRAGMGGHPCGCPHTLCRSAPTPTWCRLDGANAPHADANLETSTGHMAPSGYTGCTADSGSNMACRPSGRPSAPLLCGAYLPCRPV
jgi:hypothetical protein